VRNFGTIRAFFRSFCQSFSGLLYAKKDTGKWRRSAWGAGMVDWKGFQAFVNEMLMIIPYGKIGKNARLTIFSQNG
jgi:hypothetical protein